MADNKYVMCFIKYNRSVSIGQLFFPFDFVVIFYKRVPKTSIMILQLDIAHLEDTIWGKSNYIY